MKQYSTWRIPSLRLRRAPPQVRDEDNHISFINLQFHSSISQVQVLSPFSERQVEEQVQGLFTFCATTLASKGYPECIVCFHQDRLLPRRVFTAFFAGISSRVKTRREKATSAQQSRQQRRTVLPRVFRKRLSFSWNTAKRRQQQHRSPPDSLPWCPEFFIPQNIKITSLRWSQNNDINRHTVKPF